MSLETMPGSEASLRKLVLLLHGMPGAGKTTLALSSSSHPLLLGFALGQGLARTSNRAACRYAEIRDWAAVDVLAAEDLEPYTSIVVDTAGSAVRVLMESVKAESGSLLNADGMLSSAGWNAVGERFGRFVDLLAAARCDVIWLANDRQAWNSGEDRIDVPGRCCDRLLQGADMIARMERRMDASGLPTRVLDFSPQLDFPGKDPARLATLPVPDDELLGSWLATVLMNARERIVHAESERSKAEEAIARAARILADGRESNPAGTANTVLVKFRGGPGWASIRRMLYEAMQEWPLEFDTDRGRFLAPDSNASL